MAPRLARVARAHVAWRRNRPGRAVELFDVKVETRSTFMYGAEIVQPLERYLRGRVLAETGAPEEAVRWLGAFADQHVHNLIYLAPSHFHRARMLEELDREAEARRHYRAFLDMWEDPDPELLPMRREAEERLAKLPS